MTRETSALPTGPVSSVPSPAEPDRLFRELFQHLPAPSLVVDVKSTRIEHCNLSAARLFGECGETVVGRPLLRLSVLRQSDQRSAKEAWRSHVMHLREGEAYSFEWICRRRNGEAFVSRVSAVLHTVEGQQLALVGIVDRSDELRRSEQMQKRTQHLAQALRLANAGTWTYDPQGDLLRLDPSLYPVLGITDGDADGHDLTLADYAARFLEEADRAVISSTFAQGLAAGDGSQGLWEHRLKAPGSGGVGWLKVAYAVEKDFLTGGMKLYGVNQDVTQERSLVNNLEYQLSVRSELTEEIHHRVKNNLQIISSMLYLHQQHAPDSEQSAGLQVIRDRIASIALVHEQLYKSDSPSHLDFVAYASSLGERLFRSQDAAARGLKLTVEGGPFLLGLSDAVPCGLLLGELLTNALLHAFPGRRPGVVRISFFVDPAQYRQVVIHDDGIGFNPEKRTRTASFLPATAQLTLGSREAGWKPAAAMGLRLAARLAEQLMAELTRETPPGGGTLWRLKLPATTASPGSGGALGASG